MAVLFMGRPFSAVLNVFLTGLFLWVPGVKHALVVYADWKAGKQVDRVVGAINNPAHARKSNGGGTVIHNHYHGDAQKVNDPYIGVNGTVFRRKS